MANNKNNKKKSNNKNSNKSVSMKKEVIINNKKEEAKENIKKSNTKKTTNTKTYKKDYQKEEKPIKEEVKKVKEVKEELEDELEEEEVEEEYEDNYEDILEDTTNKTSKNLIYILLIPIIVLLILSFTYKKDSNDESEVNYTMRLDAENIVYEIENHEYVETEEETDLVKIEVKDYGIMIAELYPSVAPKTVENFKKLVSQGFYDGLLFHRVVKDFVIQTGDPTGTGAGGSDETIEGEFELNGFENTLSHTRGVLSMARQGGNPDTEETMNSADSQFFIVQKDNQESLDGRYAAFGKVILGLDVIDKVASVKTDEYEKPIKDQVVTSIKYVNEVKYEPTEGE